MTEAQKLHMRTGSSSARIELRSSISYQAKDIAGVETYSDSAICNLNIDHRLLHCKHPRLRAALQFHNQGSAVQVRTTKVSEPFHEVANDRLGVELGMGSKLFLRITNFAYGCFRVLLSPL